MSVPTRRAGQTVRAGGSPRAGGIEASTSLLRVGWTVALSSGTVKGRKAAREVGARLTDPDGGSRSHRRESLFVSDRNSESPRSRLGSAA
jgi:hypothetical protein